MYYLLERSLPERHVYASYFLPMLTELGTSVSFSLDGSLLAVGGSADSGNVGASWVFQRDVNTGLYSQVSP